MNTQLTNQSVKPPDPTAMLLGTPQNLNSILIDYLPAAEIVDRQQIVAAVPSRRGRKIPDGCYENYGFDM